MHGRRKAMKKVTIQDVAKELNLSRNTVAKALNNSNTVAYETRYIVIKKACEMGYSKVSPVVLSEFKVKGNREEVKTIVVLARRELSSFWNRIIMGISDELNKNNCKLQFNFISQQDEEEGVLPIDLKSEISGMIILSIFKERYVDLILRSNIPVVFLDMPVHSSVQITYGDVLMFEGMQPAIEIARHFLASGKERIGFIGDITYSKMIADQYHGIHYAITQMGRSLEQKYMFITHTKEHYKDKTEIQQHVLSGQSLPEVYICSNDEIAKMVEECLLEDENQRRQQIAVVPILKTDDYASQRMGRRLVQQLMWRIENREMPHELIEIHI